PSPGGRLITTPVPSGSFRSPPSTVLLSSRLSVISCSSKGSPPWSRTQPLGSSRNPYPTDRSSANPEPASAPAQACPPSRQFVAVFSTTRALLNGPARCPCTLGEVVDFSGNLCFLCAEKDIKTI